jgi:hypothetical protein
MEENMANKNKVESLKDDHDISGLLEIMENHGDWLVRLDAAEALVGLGEDKGLSYLIECFQSSDPDEKEVAREILESLNYPIDTLQLKQNSDEIKFEFPETNAKETIECGNCGKTIPYSSQNCPYCGVRLYGDQAGLLTRKPQKKMKLGQIAVKPKTFGDQGNSETIAAVEIVDIDIPLTSMVFLVGKVLLALLLILLILSLIASLIVILFGGKVIGLF